MSLRKNFVSIMLLACFACVIACGEAKQPSAPNTPTRIRLQLNWVPETEFGGIYAAEFDGLYRDAGLQLEIIKDPGGAAVPQMIDQGVCDAGIASGDQILQLRQQGGDLVAIYNIFDHTPYGLMMHAAGAPETLQEVWKGAGNLAIESGLPVWKYLGAKYGPTTRAVIPYNAVTASFLGDATIASQCFITSEPPLMDLAKVPIKVFSVSESGFDPYTVTVAVKRGKMPDEVQRKFCAAMQEGWRRYMADPAKYNPDIAKLNPAMSAEVMNMGAERMKPLLFTPWTQAHGLGSMDPARWQSMIDLLSASGVIKIRPQPESLMSNMLPPKPTTPK